MTLEFADNRLLAALGGAHQKNFVRLEQKLGVRVAMRGNLVAVEGAADAASAPPLCCARSMPGSKPAKSITLAEVDAEIRFADDQAASTPWRTSAAAIRTAPARVTRARSRRKAPIWI